MLSGCVFGEWNICGICQGLRFTGFLHVKNWINLEILPESRVPSPRDSAIQPIIWHKSQPWSYYNHNHRRILGRKQKKKHVPPASLPLFIRVYKVIQTLGRSEVSSSCPSSFRLDRLGNRQTSLTNDSHAYSRFRFGKEPRPPPGLQHLPLQEARHGGGCSSPPR